MLFLLASALAGTLPVLQSGESPAYPPEAIAEHVSGTVVLRLAVDAAGVVTDAQVTQGVRADVDAAALLAARSLRFLPATDDAGAPCPAVVDYAFSFGLHVKDETGNAAPGSLRIHVVDPDGLDVPGVQLHLAGPDAAVRDLNLGDDGTGSVPFLSSGRWRLSFSHAGFAPTGVEVDVTTGENRSLTVELTPAGPQEEVVVYASRQSWREVERAERKPDPEATTGVYELTRRDVESTPGALEDVNRAVQKLPGVASDGDMLSSFSVRGFTAGEVVFVLDRVPLDNPYHLAGFNSLFNPDMVQKVRFHASAAPAEYADTTSAVLDIQSWDGAPKDDVHDLDGSVDLSMSTARGLLMGPIGKGDDLTFAIAARRSYLEAYFGAMQALNLLDTAIAAPEYDEVSARLAWRPGKHRLLLTLMRTGDHLALVDSDDDSTFTIDGTFELDDTLYLATLDHLMPIGSSGSFQTTVSASTDDAQMFRDFAGGADRTTHRLQLFGRSDLVVPLSTQHSLRTGVSVTARKTSFEGPVDDTRASPTWVARPLADFGLPQLTLSQSEFSPNLAAYAEHRFGGEGARATPLNTRAGVRVTRVGRNGEVLASPSGGLSIPLATGTIPKLSGGLYHHAVEDPLVVDSTYGNPSIQSEKAAHLVVGLDQGLPLGTGTFVRVEGYWSELWDLVVNPDNVASVAQGVTFTNQGTGHNAGVDAMIATRWDRWQGMVTFGYLDAERTNPLNLLLPQTYVPGHAQSVTLGVSGEVQLTPTWRLTARYDFHTGRPMSSVAIDGPDTVRLAGLNDEQLGDFHQVDLRVEWRKAFVHTRWSVYLDVLNATYFQSDFLPIVTVEGGERRDSMLPHLPTRPFLGVRAEF